MLQDTTNKNMLTTFNKSNTRGQSSKCISKELKFHVRMLRLFAQSEISTKIRWEIRVNF